MFYGRKRLEIGKILRELCQQRSVELLEGRAMPDHWSVLEHSTEIQRVPYDWLSERQKRCAGPSRPAEARQDDRTSLLGDRLLR